MADIDALLARLYADGQRIGGFFSVGPEGGACLAWLVGLLNAQRVLEIGTSNGYSALWLARALEATGGGLVTLEIDQERIEMARENFAEAGLSGRIILVEGPALASLDTLGGTFDLVFIDADKAQYIDYLHAIRRLLKPGSVIVADNAASHPATTEPYRAEIVADPTLETIDVPVGGGFLISRVRRG